MIYEQNNINKGIKIMKKNKTENLELKNTIIEQKNSLEGFKKRTQAEERINKLDSFICNYQV